MKKDFENKIIEVCSSCKMACCWHGMFFCEDSAESDIEKFTVKELRAMNNMNGNNESEDYWSDEHMKDVYGESAPFGYR